MIEYTPRGYPKAALDHLATLPAGTRLTSVELAAAIGLDVPAQIISCLEYAVRHGAIRKERDPDDQRRWVWSLGDGVPLPQPRDDDDEDEPTAARAPTRTVTSPSGLPPIERPAPPPMPRPKKMRLALFSDGELVIERGSERISFTEPETRQICKYLDRLASAEAGAAP